MQVIAEVSQKCGVDEAEIHSALLSDDLHNPLVIAYNLVIDNKRIENAKAEEFNDFFAGGKKSLIFFKAKSEPFSVHGKRSIFFSVNYVLTLSKVYHFQIF